MNDLLIFLDQLWLLMWYPLRNLSFDQIMLTCPLLFLIIAMVFGIMFKFIRGITR